MQSQFDMLNYAGKVFGKPNTSDKVGGVFYVDSGATDASDGNLGTDPNQPLATLNGAMDRVTASNGDIVYLMPGHGENLDAATDAVVDVAGVRIVGVGYGTTRPTFTWTGTSGTFEVDAANTYIENVRFLSSISAVTVGVNVDAAAATFYDCEWNLDASGDDFLIMMDARGTSATSTALGLKVYNCKFMAEDAAGAANGIMLRNTDQAEIVNCHFHGDFSTSCIMSDTTDDTGGATMVSNGILIAHNVVNNSDTGGLPIDLTNADTGVVAYNLIGSGAGGLGAAGATVLDTGSCRLFENWGTTGTNVTAAKIPQTADT